MRKLILLVLIAFASLAIQAQEQQPPTGELTHYTIKEVYPSFIVITNTPTLFAEATDYYFTYDKDGYCRGGYFAYIDYARGFGDDPNTDIKEGFILGEQMFLGFYDSSADKYYKLITDVELTYKSLGLYKAVAFMGNEITLNVNEALTQSKIEYSDLPEKHDIYKDENIFFNINTENIVDLETEIVKGGGTLKTVDRWVNGGFVNRQYASVDTDTELELKTTGKGRYSREFIETTASVELFKSGPVIVPPDPTGDLITLYEDIFMKVESRPSRWGAEIWVINKTTEPIIYYFTFKNKAGGYTTASNSRRPLAGGQEVRALITRDLFETLYVNRIKLGGEIIHINAIIDL